MFLDVSSLLDENSNTKDKARDDRYFNCDEKYENYYVSSLYKDREKVSKFLEKKCELGAIKNSTHEEVYELIKNELGLERK